MVNPICRRKVPESWYLGRASPGRMSLEVPELS